MSRRTFTMIALTVGPTVVLLTIVGSALAMEVMGGYTWAVAAVFLTWPFIIAVTIWFYLWLFDLEPRATP